jgi:hypothetical protein
MAREAPFHHRVSPDELMQAAEAVAESGAKQVVHAHGKELAITPHHEAKRADQPTRRRRKTGILRPDDPLLRLAGIADSGIPGGISGKKHEYIGKALRHT